MTASHQLVAILIAIPAIMFVGAYLLTRTMAAGKRHDIETGMDPFYGDVPRIEQIRHGDNFNE